jgi:GR25 family glycosyltransferase involved in LPS biosynthesis
MDKSVDRRRRAQEQFNIHNLDVEFFRATDGSLEAPDDIFLTKGEWGCAMSHIRIWKDIVEKGYETTLVFEDDIKLKPNFIEKLKVILSELPDGWDCVNLGSDFTLSIDYADHSDNLKVGQSITTHAYLISLKCAQKFSVIDPNHLKYAIDTFMYHYPSYNLHVKVPLADQTLIYGSTIGIFRCHDYNFMFRKWWWVLLIALVITLYFMFKK